MHQLRLESRQVSAFLFPVQEAAQDLEQQMGDPAAVVLLGCPEASKVSMVAAFSPSVSPFGILFIRSCTR